MLFAIFTKVSITGTSLSTPTVVASAATLVASNQDYHHINGQFKKVGCANYTSGSGNVVRQL